MFTLKQIPFQELFDLYLLSRFLAAPAIIKYMILHFVEQLIFLGKYYQCEWRISPKRGSENHKYIE